MIDKLAQKMVSGLLIEIKNLNSEPVIIAHQITGMRAFFKDTVFYKNLETYWNTLTFSTKDKLRLVTLLDRNMFLSLYKVMALQFTVGKHDELLLKESDSAMNLFRDWIASHQVKLDTRIYNGDDRVVRRMNALARLLKPKNSDSACTAVTIVNGTLYVSMNNTGTKVDFKPIFEAITQRLTCLRDCAVAKTPGLTYEQFCNSYAVDIIKNSFHQELPMPILTQDLAKLVHSLHLEPDDCRELSLLLSATLPIFFLYPVHDKKYVVVNAATLEAKTIDIQNAPKNLGKSDIHAEQILVNYLFEHNNMPREQVVRLGVSKLCCATCRDFMSHYPQVVVQGTHGTTYDNTFNMKTGKSSVWDKVLNPKHIAPAQSPYDSPVPSPQRTPARNLVNLALKSENVNALISINSPTFFNKINKLADVDNHEKEGRKLKGMND